MVRQPLQLNKILMNCRYLSDSDLFSQADCVSLQLKRHSLDRIRC